MITFAIGDVHGCNAELQDMLEQINRVKKANEENGTLDTRIIFIGDYIDRGPNSMGVVETVMDLVKTGQAIALRGNHEQMLIDDYRQSKTGSWMYNGGKQTLDSYGIQFQSFMPKEHVDWMDTLPYYYDDGLRFFVHAGVSPGKPPEQSSQECMIWVREPFLSSDYDWGRLIVHGHTPHGVEVKANRINLDSACVFGKSLTCAIFNDRDRDPFHWLTVRRKAPPNS